MRPPLMVEVCRGSIVESAHHVLAVVVDGHGAFIEARGNVEAITFPRSCIKMLQAIPFVESHAPAKFNLDDRMIALACASHHGERAHLAVVNEWMEKIGRNESCLRCGPAWPGDETTKIDMIRKHQQPTPSHHNCSGKHLGMISACLAHGEDPTDYHLWEHPAQVRVRRVLTEASRVDHDHLPWGIDGCGIPTSALPVRNLALAMGHLVSTSLSPARQATLRTILDACRKHPDLLSGSNDFVARLMRRTHGRILVKSGAEGTYSALLPERGLAFAVKAVDGHWRAAEMAMVHMLRQLGGLTEEEAASLPDLSAPPLKNSRGETVGEIRIGRGS